jgi:hypothetical protein
MRSPPGRPSIDEAGDRVGAAVDELVAAGDADEGVMSSRRDGRPESDGRNTVRRDTLVVEEDCSAADDWWEDVLFRVREGMST